MKVKAGEIGKILGFSAGHVRYLARQGVLKGEKNHSGHWVFELSDYKDESEDLIPVQKVMKEIGVSREVIEQAIKAGKLQAKVIANTTYLRDHLELYYQSRQWKNQGNARAKWLYRGIPPHLKGKFVDFVVDIIEEMDAQKRLSPTPNNGEIVPEKVYQI